MPVDYSPPADWAPKPLSVVSPWVPKPVPVLVAPLWGRQEALGETEAEHAAFTAWLPSGDLLAAATHAQLRHADVQALHARFSWAARAREYWAHARVEGAQAIRDEQAPMRESRTLARELVNKSLALALLEVEKATAEAKLAPGAAMPEGPHRLFSNRELVQWVRTVAGLDVMRERAGLANAMMGTEEAPKLDFEKLDGDELEAWRRAREKAMSK